MALLRIKDCEQIREYNPEKLGLILGLDRSPEVKTLRRKLKLLYLRHRSSQFMDKLVRVRIDDKESINGDDLARLYVDGHVKRYNGKFKIGKTFSSTCNRVVKGTTDY